MKIFIRLWNRLFRRPSYRKIEWPVRPEDISLKVVSLCKEHLDQYNKDKDQFMEAIVKGMGLPREMLQLCCTPISPNESPMDAVYSNHQETTAGNRKAPEWPWDYIEVNLSITDHPAKGTDAAHPGCFMPMDYFEDFYKAPQDQVPVRTSFKYHWDQAVVNYRRMVKYDPQLLLTHQE